MRKRNSKIGDRAQVPAAPLSDRAAFEKAAAYCATQERSPHQVLEKLYGWGLSEDSVTQVISQLQNEGYLSIKRFAMSYARGKFHQNGWGRLRILQGLRRHQVGEDLMEAALSGLENEYGEQLFSLAKSKWDRLAGEKILVRKGKTYRYLLSKGYTPQEIYPALERLSGDAQELDD